MPMNTKKCYYPEVNYYLQTTFHPHHTHKEMCILSKKLISILT